MISPLARNVLFSSRGLFLQILSFPLSTLLFLKRPTLTVVLLTTAVGSIVADTPSAGPRVLPEGQVPQDRRLGPLKTLNDYFPFQVPMTREAWDARARELRRRILVATGLWPMPEKTPLEAVIHGRVEREDFTVDKVYFQSYPGHFVTGLLFRPKGKTGRLPAVLCPHGHGGRLQDHGPRRIRQLIVEGRERFEASGRYPKLSRCAQLARMGCVTFIFDMVGYADSVQIGRAVSHGYREKRPELEGKESWGFFSTSAELRLQSLFGLQTYNSIRALDFLSSLPDVDPGRIGVTGGSGGGTQTIILGAIDPRPIVAFPQGMVSTSMQGGCTCENASLLRIGTGNVELAALFAPRPQGMTAANDWTREMMTKGFPELKRLYTLLGAGDNVMCKALLHFPHNYNYVTRALMYSWFNRHMNLKLEEPIVEEDDVPLTDEEKTVWDAQHPAPAGGPDHERALTKWMDRDASRQLGALLPKGPDSLVKYREIVGGAFETIIGRSLPDPGAIERKKIGKIDRGEYLLFTDLMRLPSHSEELPVVSLYPKDWRRQVVVWVDGRGKSALFDSRGDPRPEIRKLLEAGTAVLSADLLYQGEFLAGGQPPAEARFVGGRPYAGYTFGYNHALFAQRVHDILTLVAFTRSTRYDPERVHLVGVAGAGPWVAAARALAGDAIDRTALDTGGFRFADVTSYRDVNFLSGSVKYGDLPALIALSAPHEMWIAGEGGKAPAVVSAAYRAAGKAGNVTFTGETEDVAGDAAAWVLRR